MGYRKGQTMVLPGKPLEGDQEAKDLEDRRCAAIGNAFHATGGRFVRPCFVVLWGQGAGRPIMSSWKLDQKRSRRMPANGLSLRWQWICPQARRSRVCVSRRRAHKRARVAGTCACRRMALEAPKFQWDQVPPPVKQSNGAVSGGQRKIVESSAQ